MPALKHVSWFFFKVCAIYAFFAAVNCGDIYAAAFRSCGNVAYATMGDGGRIRLLKCPPGIPKFDTQVKLSNIKIPGARGTMEVATRKTGYLPTAFAIALITATPIPFKRRAVAMAIAFALVGIYVILQFYIRFVFELSQPGPLDVYHFGPTMKWFMGVLLKTIALTPVTSYMVPVLIWAIVILRRDQIAHLTALVHGESPPVANPK